MVQVRTARGRIVDMTPIAKENEDKLAIGNVRMNARGDRIDRQGNILVTSEKMDKDQVKAEVEKEKSNTPEPASETPSTQSQQKAERKTRKKAPKVVSSEERTRSDGTTYTEVQYDDGSMAVEEKK